MAPGESSRLATTWTAAGAGSSLSVAMIVVGTPMPVMPQAPMRPRATSCSQAGRTASTKRRRGVLAGCSVADRTLGRHAYACRQSAPKGLAEHHLGFATTIARCDIEKGDARL